MKKTLFVLTLLAGVISGVQAGLILSDTFSYPDGNLATVSGGVWYPHGNIGGIPMLCTNGQVHILGASSAEDDSANLAGAPYMTNGPTTALYSTYSLFISNSAGLPSAVGTYISHFKNRYVSTTDAGYSFHGRVWLSSTNVAGGSNAAPGTFLIGIGNGSLANAASGQLTNILTTNVTYTVVTKMVLGGQQPCTIWLNPTTETDYSVTATDWNDPTNCENMVAYAFRQSTPASRVYVDNLKVGTHFADVAGTNQSPSISGIGPQSIPAGGNTGPLAFTVSDPETPADELTVTTNSDNQILVPNSNIVVAVVPGTGGTNRTITITPVVGQQGSANITISVSDTVNTSATTFKVTVGAPTIGAIPNQITSLNTATPAVPFAVGDTEGDALTVTKSSSNPTLVTTSDIQLGVAVPNVSSNVVVTPEFGQTGVATIMISVSDGHNTNSTSFKVTVTPGSLGLVFNEDFAYTGFDDGQALYNATGGSGARWSHVSGPTYEIQVTNVTGTNGLAYLVYTNNEDLGDGFIGSAAYDGSLGYVFYTSFTVNSSFLPSVSGDYFFHLSSSASDTINFRDRIFANRVNAATNKFRLAISNGSATPVQQFSRDLMPGATYAVVTRYNAATGDTTLWVNPTNEQNPGANASDSPGSATIGGVGLRQSGCCIGDLAIGPMKVGTAFSDVWAVPTQPHLDWMVDNSGNLVLSWNNPLFLLQSASNAAGPYTDLAPTSPFTTSISGQQYFRLRY